MSFFHGENEVTVCSGHLKRPTQLIWTFAFPYAEFWCPYCGAHEEAMGAGTDVKWTWRIHNRYVNDLKRSRKYLHANGVLNCAYFRYKGKDIKPKDMPKKLRKYYEKQAKKWRYF